MTIRKYTIFTQKVNLLFHNVEIWPNLLKESCGVNTAVSQLRPTSIILKIFSNHLIPKGQRKLLLTHFNLGNILSSLGLETATVSNNLIINSTSFQPLLAGALRHMTRYETPARERIFSAFSTNSDHFCKRLGIDTFIPASFNGIRNSSRSRMEKIIC